MAAEHEHAAQEASAGTGRFGPHGSLLLALVVAFVVRVLWITFGPAMPLRGDDKAYLPLAQALAEGRGYVINGEPIAHFMPGWPLFLMIPIGLGLGVFGGQLLVCLLSTSICASAYFLARRLVSPTAGLYAAWIAALFPPLVWYSAVLLADVPSAAVFGLWAVLAVGYGQEGGGFGRAALIGLVTGLLALFRAEMLILAPVPFLARTVAATDRRAMTRRLPAEALRGATALALLALVMAPWALYNKHRFGTAVATTTAKGIAVWMVSQDPPFADVKQPEYRAAQARFVVPGDPVLTSARFEDEGRANLAAHPGTYLRARLKDLPRFWFGSQTASIPLADQSFGVAWNSGNLAGALLKLLGFSSQAMLVLAALAGMLAFARDRRHAVVWLIVGAKVAAHAPFLQSARFSLHLAPLLLAYAGAAMAGGLVWLRQRTR